MRDRAFVEAFVTFMNELGETKAVQTAIKAQGQTKSASPPPSRSGSLDGALRKLEQTIAEKVAGVGPEERQALAQLAVKAGTDSCGKAFFAEQYVQCDQMARNLLGVFPSHLLFQLVLICSQRLGQPDAVWPKIAFTLSQLVKDAWYQDLLKLTLGLADPAKVLAKARDEDQRCEALFYTATRLKSLGQTQAYRVAMSRCAATKSTTPENSLAKTWLTAARAAGYV